MSATRLILGDCLAVLPTLEPGSVSAIVTDPPYGLVEPRSGAKGLRRSGFMGKKWDAEVPGVPIWEAVLRTLKPGGYLLAFGGTRTYHRLACAIEDAGWEIRDCLMFLYGTGMPKSKGCLKPAYEPVLLARKPGPKVLPLGIDECRVPTHEDTSRTQNNGPVWSGQFNGKRRINGGAQGDRWPANLILDEEACLLLDAQSGHLYPAGSNGASAGSGNCYGNGWPQRPGCRPSFTDSGGASRFFYCAKASKEERGEGTTHPTQKPLSLMLWLVKLVCPPGGVCLDPFMGSGTTGVACQALGRGFVGIELDPAYFAIAQRRLSEAQGPLFTGTAANSSDSHLPSAPSQGSLFPEGE
jgi:DNA modification methylase